MSAWVIWAIVAVAFAIGEVLTPGLFWLGPIALAGLLAAIVAAIGLGTGLQLVVFILASIASLGILRPIARAHLHMPHALRTGTAALVGARGLVLDRTDANGGRVKIGGEVWSARAFDETQVIEPGVSVEVFRIEGATALVYQ